MAKKPKPAPVANTDELTDEEIAVLAAAEAEAEPVAAVVEPVVEPVAAPAPAVAYITSFNQTSLAEANRVAREQLAEENALVVKAHAAALEAIAGVLKGRGDPVAVFNSLLAKPR